ncbi:Glycine betaine transporter BetL [Pseudomonas sp. MM223]|nr:Glycine betaine transporter BetL [Pseudomonas sp. MM223]
MAVFGGTALKDEQQARQAYQQLPVAEQTAVGPFQGGPVLEATRKETTTAMFTLLDRLGGPALGAVLSVIICLLLAVHFVTAADAGTQVLCMLNSLGSINPPNWIRVLWCVLEGAIAASLVIAGGLLAIQMASIVVGLPIAFYMLLTGYSLMRSLFASEVVIAREVPVSMAVEQTRTSGEMA